MTTLDLLAPDQRAVLELVLRQDRSYGELSELLGIPERQVRDRAEAALRSLAGDPDRDVDTGRLTDWLLGQQTDRAAGATRTQLARSEPARAWAALAAARLREVGGERIPAVPEGAAEGGAAAGSSGAAGAPPRPRPRRDDVPPRPRPLRDGGAAGAAPAGPGAGDGDASRAAAGVAAGAGRSSRVGGAVLIGVVAIVVVAGLVWFLSRGGDSTSTATTPASSANATATATATPQATGNDILLKGSGSSSKAAGLMRLFKAQGGGVQFAIGAQDIPNNRKGEFYAVWFTKRDGTARLLGFPQTAVTNGVLTVGGPGTKDKKAFPRLFATYDKVLITRETEAKPTRPGPAVLTGTLPHGQS
jgi:hypothetical protein